MSDEKIFFEDYKDDIIEALHNRQEDLLSVVNEPVMLLYGFSFIAICDNVNKYSPVNSNGNIPFVSVMGNTTGLIYKFNLCHLLPELAKKIEDL